MTNAELRLTVHETSSQMTRLLPAICRPYPTHKPISSEEIPMDCPSAASRHQVWLWGRLAMPVAISGKFDCPNVPNDLWMRYAGEGTGGATVADIFISYSKPDRDKVVMLAAYLESEGWTVWWDKISIRVSPTVMRSCES